MNVVCLVGNLTRDPELTTTPQGVSLCKFTVAINRRFTSADGTREADFLPVVVWRNQADNCSRYLKKGSKVAVQGYIQTRTYDPGDGSKRTFTEVVADDVRFLSARESLAESAGYDDAPPPPPSRYDRGEQQTRRPVAELKPVEDEDLPF